MRTAVSECELRASAIGVFSLRNVQKNSRSASWMETALTWPARMRLLDGGRRQRERTHLGCHPSGNLLPDRGPFGLNFVCIPKVGRGSTGVRYS